MQRARRAALLSFLALAAPAPGRGGEAADPLEEVRRRLRADVGVCEGPAPAGEDLPLVALTVLPGDTHGRLALDLTGSRDAEAVLRKIQPVLEPGRRIHVPRALLTPGLADPRLEPLALGAGPTSHLTSCGSRATRRVHPACRRRDRFACVEAK